MKAFRWVIGIVAFVSLLMPASTLAQDTTSGIAKTVTVLGTGTVTVQPDIAAITIGVDVIRETVPEALTEANTKMTAIISALKAEGVLDDDIQTAYFSVYAVRDYNAESTGSSLPPIVGYTVSNQVSVTIRDVTWQRGLPSDEVGAVIGAAIDAGANDIYGVTFSVSDTTNAERDARALAVQNANERASELASAAGKRVGDVIAMSEGITFMPLSYAYAEGRGGAGAGGAPILGGTVEIVIDVTVTYELL